MFAHKDKRKASDFRRHQQTQRGWGEPRLHRRRRDRWKNDMENAKSQDKPKGSSRGGPELGVVSIDFNPGPDAQDRLRRLFTLLVKYATKDKLSPSDTDSPSKDDPAEDEG